MNNEDMTNEIIQRLARIEVLVSNQREADDRASERLEAHSKRLDKLERIAYVALGVAVASGLPQVATLIGG